MVGISFERPVGPYADTKELEYVSALMQTCSPSLRQNGTIDARDIMYFLSSRHGIRVDREVVRQAILHELCGSPLAPVKAVDAPDASPDDDLMSKNLETVEDALPSKTNMNETEDDISDIDNDSVGDDQPSENDESMDLCQMLGLLLIPYLRSGNCDGHKRDSVERVLEIALETIWAELQAHSAMSGGNVTIRDGQRNKPSQQSEEGVWMTTELLRETFETFGEFGLTESLLHEMMNIATSAGAEMDNSVKEGNAGSKFYMTKSSFLAVLTADVQLYNPNIDTTESTHSDDARSARNDMIFKGARRRGSVMAEKSLRSSTTGGGMLAATQALTAERSDPYPFHIIYTASNIDNSADTYRSSMWFTLVWVSTIFVFLSYVSGSLARLDGFNRCEENELDPNLAKQFFCKVGLSLANWTIIFLQLMVLGFVWVMVANLGNSTCPIDTLKAKMNTASRVIAAMVLVVFATILSFFFEVNVYFINTTKVNTFVAAYWIVLVMGCFILCIQGARFIGIFFPLGWIASGGMARKEQRTKMAATCKMDLFVEHAALLHVAPDELGDAGGISSRGASKAQKEESVSLMKPPDLQRNQSAVSESVLNASTMIHANNRRSRNGSKSKSGTTTTTSNILLNYHTMADTTQVTGGVLWTFKRIFNGSLFEKEGVFLHSRLLSVNSVQFLIILILIGGFGPIVNQLENFLNNVDDGCDLRLEGIYIDADGNNKFSNDTVDSEVSARRYLEEVGTRSPLGDINVIEKEAWTRARFLQDTAIMVEDITFRDENSTFTLTETAFPTAAPTEYNETEAAISALQQQIEELYALAVAHGWGYDPDKEGFQNLFNVNETHWTTDLIDVVPGQFPRFNGTHFEGVEYKPDSTRFGPPTVCYDYYITNGTEIVENPNAFANSLMEALNIQKWEYTFGAAMGLLFAIMATTGIACVYIPSFVSSVIKLRSGYSPSLKGDFVDFLMFRNSPDQTAIIWGSAFWGVLFTALGSFFFFFLIFFCCVFSLTRSFVANIIAGYIGVFTTIGVKILVMTLLRKFFYAGGYYRRRPAAGNIMNVILECWSLGLSAGTMTARTVKLLVVTFFYLGRIDTPMLAPGVGQIGSTNLDPAPNAFRKDLLVHEAHRHPYIERLGLLYMIKLFNGKEFGTRAGAHWRLLLVLSLMPWMRTYRISRCTDLMMALEANDDVTDDEDEDDENANDNSILMNDKTVRFHDPIFDKNDSVSLLVAKRRALKRDLKNLNRLLSSKVAEADLTGDLSKRDRARLMEDSTFFAKRTRLEDVSLFSI